MQDTAGLSCEFEPAPKKIGGFGGLASTIDQDLSARMAGLHMLAGSSLLQDPARWGELYQEAQGFRRGFGSHVILADAQLRMLLNTRVPFGSTLPALPQPKGRSAARTALESGQPAVGDTFLGPIGNTTMVAVAVPSLQQSEARYLLLTTFEASHLQKHLDQLALPEGWSVSLLDGRGEAIAAARPAV